MDAQNWGVGQEIEVPHNVTIKGILDLLMGSIDSNNDGKKVISLGIGDPTAYSCFYTTSSAQEAVVESLRSAKFNGYAPTSGLPQTRRALAEYLSRDLPYKLSLDDVYVTSGCTQAIEIALSILTRPGANILLPRPCFPIYELCAVFRNIEIRHFDLLPEKGWEVDLKAVEDLADHNTVAMVIINPGNPCGNVYTYQQLKKIAEVAKRLRIAVIADEVYGHLAFGANPFVPMGVFGSIAPVLTLGSLSKRWLVPGWRLGWLVTNDPDGILKSPKFVERLKKYCDICGGPATFMQVKLNISLLKDISDELDFCFKLAKEESVIVLPGLAVGLKNWVRITFAVEPSALEEALERVKCFCERHSSLQNGY
ncbi:probable aminotransferase TAT2 isoform X2 [Henckelia pumila]|uniref:probable aminotransferase TAT2 isoform X2 n=1 Tax=Henckelia pumila TaxID=405737 RepID=UPI003C6E28FF